MRNKPVDNYLVFVAFAFLILIVSESLSVFAGGNIPSDLWVIRLELGRPAEMVLAQSLQGLTGRDMPQIWLDKQGTMSAIILQQLEDEGAQLHYLDSVWDLPDFFWQIPNGLIEYNLNTRSLNVAISLCGLLNAVAVDESILDEAEAKGLSIVYDARGKSEDQIFDQYLEFFSSGMAIEETETRPWYLRDFAVQNKAFTFYDLGSPFRRRVAAVLASRGGTGATFYGWGTPNVSEHTWISDFSLSNGQGVACGLCINLSGMSKLPLSIPERRPHAPPALALEGERIVAFVLTDGDNIRWLTGDMPLDPRYFANRWRGQLNMNWEISPLLAEVAPRVLKYFYDNATDMDGFLAAGSPGYRYIHLEPDDPRGTTDAAQTAPYLDASHLSIVGVINENAGGLEETIPLLDLPEVDGVAYKAFSPYNRLNGQMCYHTDPSGRNKFAVSYKFRLWQNARDASPQEVAEAISQMPSSPEYDPGSYALINAHAWSFLSTGGPIEAVKETIDLLPANTRVVTIDDFFALLYQSFGGGALPVRKCLSEPASK